MLNLKDPKHISYLSAGIVLFLLILGLSKTASSTLIIILFLILFGVAGVLSYKKFITIHEQNITLKHNSQKDPLTSQSRSMAVKSTLKFSDIGGISEVKVELEEIIDFLKNPLHYKNFGARLPRGVLLVGEPGVGKTMIAKAVAGEADVPFYYQSGASFVQIYVGMGAKRVHELFESAKLNTPSIIFIDEIDAIGKTRDGSKNEEREATLNQLLTEMDGFEADSNVIVIAATNKIEVLDSALLRAGRFDRRIHVGLPNLDDRDAILQKYLSNIPNGVETKELAKNSVGFSGALLEAFVNEAALEALRHNAIQVNNSHFNSIRDKVMLGKRKVPLLNDKEKEVRIHYISAKATIATYFDLDFEKVTLTNFNITTKEIYGSLSSELRSRVIFYLSGMLASQIKFDEHSSDVEEDLCSAKELVSKMINSFSMGDQIVGEGLQESELLSELSNEGVTLINSLERVIALVEKDVREFESISKEKIKVILSEIL